MTEDVATPATAPGREKKLHTQSSRFRGEWHFPRGKGLKEKRVEVNAEGVRRVKDAMLEEAALEGKPPPTLDPSIFITWEEQQKMCLFYETKIVSYCKFFKFDTDGTVQATAITFFKRFYLANTIMDYDPKLILLTCLFLAAKVENSHMPLTDFLAKVPKAPPPEVILELEFVLCRGLEFQFMVQPLKWALHGLFLDMQAYLLLKHTNPKSPELRDDLTNLATTYSTSLTLSQTSLHTDLPLTHYPSQIALGCLLLASKSHQFRDEVERYVSFRLAGEVANSGPGGFVAEEGSGDGLVELKIMLGEVEEAVLRGGEAAVAAVADKEEARRIDVKLQGCRNPEFLKDGPLYQKRRRQESEEKEAKRQKKMDKEREGVKDLSSIME
ncbi:hypothetical protein HDU67_003685 [Dinochytrium kinnereticum]|nr:hypothetical protein HDU67_003685 [Dinochytrium kinnereticum]